MRGMMLKLSDILPSRKNDDKSKVSRKYETVVASVRGIGTIEPPVVHPLGSGPSVKYLLLDGHLRIKALKELGEEEVFCVISTDD